MKGIYIESVPRSSGGSFQDSSHYLRRCWIIYGYAGFENGRHKGSSGISFFYFLIVASKSSSIPETVRFSCAIESSICMYQLCV